MSQSCVWPYGMMYEKAEALVEDDSWLEVLESK